MKTKMKKAIMVHGWGGSSGGGWFDWLKHELEKKKIEVHAFDMPDTDNPKIKDWIGYLEDNIPSLDEETYLVGHSIGCQTIMRFLEKTSKGKVAGCVFVAGWFTLKGLGNAEIPIAKPWLETPIDFNKVKRNTNKILTIFSDDDPYVPLSDSELFKKNLNAKIIIIKNKGHIDELNKSEIKIILDFIEK